jgi:hypothetical protein
MRSGMAVAVTVAVVGVLVFGGCQTASYRGALPSARTLKGGPRQVGDFYLGMDFQWSIDRAGDYYGPPIGEPMAAAVGEY